jgi:hypothetical protein
MKKVHYATFFIQVVWLPHLLSEKQRLELILQHQGQLGNLLFLSVAQVA